MPRHPPPEPVGMNTRLPFWDYNRRPASLGNIFLKSVLDLCTVLNSSIPCFISSFTRPSTECKLINRISKLLATPQHPLAGPWLDARSSTILLFITATYRYELNLGLTNLLPRIVLYIPHRRRLLCLRLVLVSNASIHVLLPAKPLCLTPRY
jgi:hypothetical protein